MKPLTRLIIPLAAWLMPAAAIAESLDQRWPVSSDATVSVSTVAGEIDIGTWDRDEVHLTGTLGKDQELEVKESDTGISIKTRHKDDEDDYDENFLKLMIPAGASVEATGVSADITINGSRGARVSAESVSGDIEVSAESERLDLVSVSGDIGFAGTSARTGVESVSGDIDIDGVAGEISVSTVSGDVELKAGSVSLGKFETVSGSLDLAMSVSDGGRLTIEGMAGDVNLLLPASQSAGINAVTFSGDIRSDFGEAKNESFGPGSQLKVRSGDSGASIRVETFSGDIHIGHK